MPKRPGSWRRPPQLLRYEVQAPQHLRRETFEDSDAMQSGPQSPTACSTSNLAHTALSCYKRRTFEHHRASFYVMEITRKQDGKEVSCAGAGRRPPGYVESWMHRMRR